MGADDYLSKPCNPRELLARLRALIRRSHISTSSTVAESSDLSIAGIFLDRLKCQVSVNNIPMQLTAAEFNVLKILMLSAGEVISKEVLTKKVLQRELTLFVRTGYRLMGHHRSHGCLYHLRLLESFSCLYERQASKKS